MRKCIVLIFFLLLGNMVFPQAKISGKVTDVATGESLPGSVVYVYNGTRLTGYTVANSNGEYSITPKGEFTHLVFYLMGYSQNKVVFSALAGQDIVRDVALEESTQVLKSITVKPVAMKIEADTVTYDAFSFKRREDQTLAQVLSRLPNVKVTSSGGVTVNGQQINKFYIEDMDLLGGRYGLAVRNIRADDIAAINIYHNHQPVKALEEVEASNRHAVNIKLKEKAKGRWLVALGLALGTGNDEDLLHSAKLNAMNFSSDRQTVITAKSDNTGEDIITETFLQNIKPGAYSLDELQTGIKDLFYTQSVVLPVDKNLYYNNSSNVFTLSNLNKINAEKSIKSSVVLVTDRSTDNTDVERVLFPQDGSEIHIADSTHLKRENLGISGEITYTHNGSRNYLENVFKYNVNFDDASGVIGGATNNYSSKYDLPKLSLANEFELVANRGTGKAARINAKLGFTNRNQQMAIKSDVPLGDNGWEYLVQDINAKNFSGNIYTKFLKRKGYANFSITPGVKVLYDRYESLFTPQTENAHNNISLFSLQPYVRPEYVYGGDKVKINFYVPLTLRYDISNQGDRCYFLYNPSFALRYRLGNDLLLNFRTAAYNRVGGVEQMASGYIYSGYRDFKAYRTVEERESYDVSGGLSYNNLSKFISASITAMYAHTNSNLMPWETFLQDFTYMVYEDGNNHSTRQSVVLNARKLFGINKFSIEGNIALSKDKAEQYLQGELYKHYTREVSADLNMQFSPVQSFSLIYNGSLSHNTFMGESAESRMDTYINRGSVVIYPIKKLQIKAGINHFIQKYGDDDISLLFVDASAEYNFSKKFRVYVKLKNITDEKYYQYSFYSNASSVTRRVALRGAEYLAGISVDF